MKMLKVGLVMMMVALFALQANAQDEEASKKGFDKSRLFVGGNFGLSFGDNTFINISPQVGYMFSRYFAGGVGINGQYSETKFRNFNGDTYAKSNYGVAGMSVFGRVYPIRQIFASVQPELNYIWGKTKYYNPAQEFTLNSKILPSLLLGGGGVIPMGRAGGLLIMVQYDVLNKDPKDTDPGTPYGDRVFYSIGFTVGM